MLGKGSFCAGSECAGDASASPFAGSRTATFGSASCHEIDRYNEVEAGLLEVKPGVTDISSIVFSDEGDILSDSEDPDLGYNRLIRPWKSRMGLFYVEKQNIILDIVLIVLTALAIVSKQRMLALLGAVLRKLDDPDKMIEVACRTLTLTPYAPPGADRPVTAGDFSWG